MDRAEEIARVEKLARRTAEGNRMAFSELVSAMHRVVFRLAFRITSSEADAEDVVQETFLRAWQGISELKDPKAAYAWICGIARNVSKDKLRAAPRRKNVSLDEPVREGASSLSTFLSSEDQGPEDLLGSEQVGAFVRQAVGQLKEKHRLVIQLREMDGMSYEELALALGCSVGTVESRLFRARKALGKKLRALARELGKELQP